MAVRRVGSARAARRCRASRGTSGPHRSPTTGGCLRGGACRLLRCSDGWVAVSLPRESDRELVPALIERPADEPWTAVGEWAAGRTAPEIVERARLLGLAVAEVGEGGPAVQLPDETGALPGDRPPLVVDFSALWAGPAVRPAARAGRRERRQGGDADPPRRRPPRAPRLLRPAARGPRVARAWSDRPRRPGGCSDGRLVAAADVVIEASRPRALAGLGLDAARGRGARARSGSPSPRTAGRAAATRIGLRRRRGGCGAGLVAPGHGDATHADVLRRRHRRPAHRPRRRGTGAHLAAGRPARRRDDRRRGLDAGLAPARAARDTDGGGSSTPG